ncbi:MAG: hypothetical protein V4586_04090 [Pseudomonadota bacterium]
MTTFDYGALCAELDAIVAAKPSGTSATGHPVFGAMYSISCAGSQADSQPHIVADATSGHQPIAQGNKLSGKNRDPGSQYADTTTSHASADQLIPHTADDRHTHESTISSPPSSPCSLCEDREAAVWRIAARNNRSFDVASNHQTFRKPRRLAAQLNRVAVKKTWSGTKSKGRKDRLTPAEKFVAAIWSTTDAKGVAVTLNLGIRRESMLIEHDDPRRRMTQNLHRRLSAAGFGKVPYAFAFEMTPERDGGRLHLHGVMDTSELSDADLERLGEALRKAASHASRALGGQRQLDMAPLFDAAGWADYLLEDATRTARDLRIDTPFMVNDPMKRLAKSYFDRLRMEVNRRADDAKVASTTTPRKTKIQPEDRPQGFTVRSTCDRRRLSGERDAKLAGGVFSHARHRPQTSIAPKVPRQSSSQRQPPTSHVEMSPARSDASPRRSPMLTSAPQALR